MSKGSKQRPTDKVAFDANYDAIFRKKSNDGPLSDELVKLYEQEAVIWKLKGISHERGTPTANAGHR